jgi:hypothetical protein
MNEQERAQIDPGFSLVLPPGWLSEPDEDEGVTVFLPDGPGLMHLVAFPDPGEEVLDPAEELYAFLEEQGVEIEEDEVEDIDLSEGAELSYCEYIAEDEEEDDESTYWLVGVATAPGRLVFINYSCAAGEEDLQREVVRALLGSLRLTRPGNGLSNGSK